MLSQGGFEACERRMGHTDRVRAITEDTAPASFSFMNSSMIKWPKLPEPATAIVRSPDITDWGL